MELELIDQLIDYREWIYKQWEARLPYYRKGRVLDDFFLQLMLEGWQVVREPYIHIDIA